MPSDPTRRPCALPHHRITRSWGDKTKSSFEFSAKDQLLALGVLFQAPPPASTGGEHHSRKESNVSITATHIGTKLIAAEPMTRLAYNEFRGWALPADENGDDEGFLVEYLDGGKANVEGREGYISWSPKEVFDAAYRPVSGLTFGLAIEALKLGKKVARAGWNGKGMWIAYTPASSFAPQFAKPGHAARHRAVESPGEAINLAAHIDMLAADGTMVIGWLASQTDMLAEDWQVVE